MDSDDAKQQKLNDLCRALKANTPDLTTLRYNNSYSYSLQELPRLCNSVALQLGEALRNNTIVTTILLRVGTMTLAGAQDIAHFISHNPSLRTLSLWSDLDEERDTREMHVVDLLLIAAGVSGRIEQLNLNFSSRFGVPAFVGSMLGMRNSLTELSFSFREGMNDVSVDFIASAVNGLSSLEKLSMHDESADSRCAAAVVNRLVGHPCLQVLTVFLHSETGSGALCSGAVRSLLLSPTPIKGLVLNYEECFDESVNFVNHGLAGLLVDVAGHHTLRDLSLFWDNEHGRRIDIEGAMCVATLLKTNRTIEILECDSFCLHGFVKILESLVGTDANLALKELKLYSTWDGDKNLCACGEGGEGSFEGLVTLLPLMNRLEKLTLGNFKSHFRPEQTMDVVRAFERNSSLTWVDIDSLFNLEQNKAIEYYATRNKYRPVLVEASVAKMVLTDFAALQTDHDELTALSLMLETLRSRDDWPATTAPPGGIPSKRRSSRKRQHTALAC